MEAINLGIPFDADHAPELKVRLLELLHTHLNVTLDLRWAEAVDIAGLQLLLATAGRLEASGGKLTVWPGPVVEEAAGVAGLAASFAPLFEAPTAEVW